MTKLNRILVVLLLLQICIFTIGHFIGSDDKIVKPQKLLKNFSSDEVSQITISDQNKSVELAKQRDNWVLSSGGNYPVEKNKIDDLLAKLPALEAAEPVVTKSTLHRALEVAEGKFQRRITLTCKGKKPIEFFLGSSPGIKKVHFRFANQDNVFVVSDLSTWDIGTSASNWVDTNYLKVEKDNVIALTLKNANGEIRLNKGSDGTLTMANLRKNDTIKQSEIDSLLSSATAVMLDKPIGQKLEASYGLDNPQAVLTLVTETKKEKPKEGAQAQDPTDTKDSNAAGQDTADDKASPPEIIRKTYVLKIGAKKDDAYYAKSDQSPFIVSLNSYLEKTFVEKKPQDLLGKKEGKKVGANHNNPETKTADG